MRIAVITNSRIPSLTANSIQAMKMCQALTQLGHELRVFAPRETEPASWESLAAHYGLRTPLEIEWLPSLPILKRYDFTLYSILASRKFKADLVYTWLLNPAVLSQWLGWPVVIELHADVRGRLGPLLLRRFWGIRGRKRILTTTQTVRHAVEAMVGRKFSEDDILIAPNGIDLNDYEDLPSPAEARHRLGINDRITVGFTGHFYPGRGIELLFELARRMPAVQFLWVGGTPDLVRNWRGKLVQAGITNVLLTGFVEHSRIPLYQAAADVLLMPYARLISDSSGQEISKIINPMKLFEYMAAERAIITSDIPVIHEVLNSDNAIFCPPEDVNVWHTVLSDLIADEKRRIALSRQARRDVERYTWLARAQRALAGLEK